MSTDKQTEKDYQNTIYDLQQRLHEKDILIKKLKRVIKDGVMYGKDEIMEVYGWSEYKFKSWVQKGLFCLYVDRTYIAHKDNISEYFKGITRKQYKNIPDDEEK
jgi:hypothetical protein